MRICCRSSKKSILAITAIVFLSIVSTPLALASQGSTFVKTGNNGTASCDTFCASAVWGNQVGTCASAFNTSTDSSVECHVAPGFLKGAQLTCVCNNDAIVRYGNNGTASCQDFCQRTDERCIAAYNTLNNEHSSCATSPGFLEGGSLLCSCTPATFVKGGNNGTVSCKTYCESPHWGDQVGTCVSAFNTSADSSVDCNDVPGFIKGGPLTCTCNNNAIVRYGNNGTASCQDFCQRTNEKCIAAYDTLNNIERACEEIPGFLEGKHLKCSCEKNTE